jgi:hypothetical protein
VFFADFDYRDLQKWSVVMWRFESKDDLRAFRTMQGEGVVSIYLDDGMERNALDALYAAKTGFDQLVGEHWHILLPHIDGGLTPEFVTDSDGYDIKLSLEIVDQFGIDRADLPVLIFPHPNNEEVLLTVILGRLTAEQRAEKLRVIADIVTRPRERSTIDPMEFRRIVVDEVRARMQGDALVPVFGTVTKAVGGICRLIAGYT